MRMSGPSRTRDAPRGFTLLELIVVLAILGLAAALAAPNLLRSVESWQAAAQVDRLVVQVEGLPARARGRGLPIVVGAEALEGEEPPLAVDPEWTLAAPEAWTVQANGFCEGGEVLLRRGAREWRLRAEAPFCTVDRADP